jgi:hypothetical protein
MKIYLASPYTHPDPEIVNARVKAINAHAAHLMRPGQGHIVFSPISHSHPIAMENNLPTTFEFWAKQNHAMIDWCNVVMVLRLYRWQESKGIADEIRYAKLIDKKVVNDEWEEI